jgi:hypothetical protein
VLRMYGLFGLVAFALWIYCLLDVIATDSTLVRNLPKTMWLFLVIVLSTVGSVAWLVLGRPERAGWWPGDSTYRRPRSATWKVRGPEDDPGFVANLGPSSSRPQPPAADDRRRQLAEREAELRRRELDAWEADLKRREADLDRRPPADGGPPEGT